MSSTAVSGYQLLDVFGDLGAVIALKVVPCDETGGVLNPV